MKKICTLILASSIYILLAGCSPEVYSALYAFNEAVMSSMNEQYTTESDTEEEQQSYTTAYENTTRMVPPQYQVSRSGMMRRPLPHLRHIPARHSMTRPFHSPHHVHPGFMRRGIFRPGIHRPGGFHRPRHSMNRFGRFRI